MEEPPELNDREQKAPRKMLFFCRDMYALSSGEGHTYSDYYAIISVLGGDAPKAPISLYFFSLRVLRAFFRLFCFTLPASTGSYGCGTKMPARPKAAGAPPLAKWDRFDSFSTRLLHLVRKTQE